MAPRKVRVMPRYKAPVILEPLTGSALIQPVTAPNRFAAEVARLVDDMRHETVREIIAVYPVKPPVSLSGTFDASSGAGVITKVLNALKTRFMRRFKALARSATPEMVERMSKDSQQRIRSSVREVLPNMTIDNTRLPQNVKDVIEIGTKQAASMIVTIPEKYLSDVANSTLQAILHGRGTKELEEDLDKYGHKTRNWARNVALDQTRKVYNALNRENMRALGITKFVWVHSNSTQNPRKYHQTVLKGQTFSIDDPPVIDPRTGERGFPGQLPYCRCTMRPVIELAKDE